jgi:hypothetical protein
LPSEISKNSDAHPLSLPAVGRKVNRFLWKIRPRTYFWSKDQGGNRDRNLTLWKQDSLLRWNIYLPCSPLLGICPGEMITYSHKNL